MKRLFADFNDMADDKTLPLTCSGSLEAIAKLTEPLTEGERVWLSDGELRVEAEVHQRADGSWEARSNWQFER